MPCLGRAVIGNLLVATIFTLFRAVRLCHFCMTGEAFPQRSNSDAEASLSTPWSPTRYCPASVLSLLSHLREQCRRHNLAPSTLLEDTIPTVAITTTPSRCR